MIVFPWEFFTRDLSHGLETKQRDGKFGIVRSAGGEVVLPYEYDNIFEYIDGYVLCKRGKWGIVRWKENGELEWIAPCEYDAVDRVKGNWIFSNQDELGCYFYCNHTVRMFQNIFFFEAGKGRYILAEDDEFHYIIDAKTGRELWTCPYDAQAVYPDLFFYWFLGQKNGLPLFYETENDIYVLPHDSVPSNIVLDGWPGPPPLLMPITVNGRNVVNILDGETGLKVSTLGKDFPEDITQDDGFDEAAVEVRVTLKRGDRTEERSYPVPGVTVFYGDRPNYDWWGGEGN